MKKVTFTKKPKKKITIKKKTNKNKPKAKGSRYA